MLRFSFLLVLVLMSGCLSVQEAPSGHGGFFNLETFVQKEIEDKSQSVNTFQKTVTLNGETEQQQLNHLDLDKELRIFSNANIDKTSWLDRYSTDSVFNAGMLERLHYQALDDELATQELIIFFSKTAIDSLVIRQQTANLISDAKKYLFYSPQTGYRIESHQEVWGIDEKHDLTVEVAFQ